MAKKFQVVRKDSKKLSNGLYIYRDAYIARVDKKWKIGAIGNYFGEFNTLKDAKAAVDNWRK